MFYEVPFMRFASMKCRHGGWGLSRSLLHAPVMCFLSFFLFDQASPSTTTTCTDILHRCIAAARDPASEGHPRTSHTSRNPWHIKKAFLFFSCTTHGSADTDRFFPADHRPSVCIREHQTAKEGACSDRWLSRVRLQQSAACHTTWHTSATRRMYGVGTTRTSLCVRPHSE